MSYTNCHPTSNQKICVLQIVKRSMMICSVPTIPSQNQRISDRRLHPYASDTMMQEPYDAIKENILHSLCTSFYSMSLDLLEIFKDEEKNKDS